MKSAALRLRPLMKPVIARQPKAVFRGVKNFTGQAGSQHTQIPSPKASDTLLAWIPARVKIFIS